MSQEQLINRHPTGRTTGTVQRPGQDHVGLALTFDLPAELAKLRQEENWQRNGRNTRTLVKEENLRLVLIAMQGGTQISEHHTAGRLAIHVISGHLQLAVPSQRVDLPERTLVALDYEVQYEILAHEESALLLTVAWEGA